MKLNVRKPGKNVPLSVCCGVEARAVGKVHQCSGCHKFCKVREAVKK